MRMCFSDRSGMPYPKRGVSSTSFWFLGPGPADLREGCHQISNMWEILLAFGPWGRRSGRGVPPNFKHVSNLIWCVDPDPADQRDGVPPNIKSVTNPTGLWTLTPPICVRGATEIQTCGNSYGFLAPDPADPREGCRRISEMLQIPCVFGP